MYYFNFGRIFSKIGHVEKKDSTNLEAAIRETEEESGLKSSDYKFIEDSQQTLKYNVPPNNREKTVVYWLAELTNNDAKIVLSNEHKDFKWVNLQNAFDLIPYPDMRSMLENMHGFLLTKYY